MNAPFPFFMETPHGRIFCVHHRPSGDVAQIGNVLYVPPFNEENNRCRSMVTLQAQALAARGIGTLVVDLYGTGDSDGDYEDARWALWKEDIAGAIDWLKTAGNGPIALWGIRSGALLILDALRALSFPPDPIAMWQPVVDGKQYFTQFLRMRIAAEMDRTDIPKVTTKEMREQFATGSVVEVAGYPIHPELAAAFDAAHLSVLTPRPETPLLWLEYPTGAQAELSPPSQKVIDSWTNAGARIEASTFGGPAFWQLHERSTALDVIPITADWFARRLAGH